LAHFRHRYGRRCDIGAAIDSYGKMFGGAKPESGGGGMRLTSAIGLAAALSNAKNISFASGSAQRGSVEAGRIVQQARESPFASAIKPVVDKLDAIKKNTDPKRAAPAVKMARGRI
jgi:hypothetical protein